MGDDKGVRMESDSIDPVPRKSRSRDVAETVLVAATSAVPVLGGPFSVVLGNTLQGTYQRRLTMWLEDLGTALDNLIAKVEGLEASELPQNEAFVDSALRAARIAGSTANEEKLAALQAAVLNAALPSAPSEDLQQIFLTLVEDLTASHLRLLALLDDPPAYLDSLGIPWPDVLMGGHSGTVERVFPEWDRSFYDTLARDLHNRGLLASGSLHTSVSGHGLRQSQTTALGKQFLSFLRSPDHLG